MAFGKIIHVEKEQGLHFFCPVFTTKKKVSTKVQTLPIQGANVPDARGSPMNVSAVVTYSVRDPVESYYHVMNLTNYVTN